MPSEKAIIAAASEDIRASLSSMCAEAEITDITVTDGGSLKELFAENAYDIALLVLPFEDRFGADTAAFLSKSYDTEVVTFVPSKVYDDVCAKLMKTGILILPKSAPRALIINASRDYNLALILRSSSRLLGGRSSHWQNIDFTPMTTQKSISQPGQ